MVVRLIDLSTEGQLVLAGVGGGAFLLASLIALLDMTGKVRAAVVLGGPVVAIAAFLFAGPQRNCHYDCLARAAWGIITLAGAIGWLAGFGITYAMRNRAR
jgi:hypothetical protein